MQKKTLVLRWTLTLILGAAPTLVWAGTREHRDVATSLVAEATAEASGILVELPDIAVRAPGQLVSAVLEFRADLEPGDEVELWLAPEEGLPWALTEDRPYRLDIWRADARTADLVRFDLTEVVRRSLNSRETDLPKFMIRRVPDDDGEWANLDFSETQLTVSSDGR